MAWVWQSLHFHLILYTRPKHLKQTDYLLLLWTHFKYKIIAANLFLSLVTTVTYSRNYYVCSIVSPNPLQNRSNRRKNQHTYLESSFPFVKYLNNYILSNRKIARWDVCISVTNSVLIFKKAMQFIIFTAVAYLINGLCSVTISRHRIVTECATMASHNYNHLLHLLCEININVAISNTGKMLGEWRWLS